ncbi:MAG: maltose ABC transporter permease MalG [Halobacteriovoraceae bacterium]|nr:maltose ABC transporter permease MalG [Halobacteriovoraceae bacterium]
MMKKDSLKARNQMIILAKHLGLVAFLLIILFPIFYIFSLSVNQAGSLETKLIPDQVTLNNWRYLLGIPYSDPITNQTVLSPFPILIWLWNSIKVAGITSALMLLLSTTAAYALSRFDFRGKSTSLLSLMIIQMFPNVMSMVAFYLMLNFIGDYVSFLGTDTHGGLILVYLGGTPFNIWLIKGYFDGLPRSIEEAAILDGCNKFQAFIKIIIPLSAPILAVVGLLTFINTFSDFILPSILLKSQDKFTFAVGIQIFISDAFSGRWGQFASACILGAVPISALFYSIHKYIVSGLASGGSKGG